MAICPEVFRRNRLKDYMEVVELTVYPEEKTEEAISNCPTGCIIWRETG